jgi:hypothetical protein
MTDWTSSLRQKLQLILNDFRLTLVDDVPPIPPPITGHVDHMDDCIHNLSRFWKETDRPDIDPMSVCMLLISTLCDEVEQCTDPRWRDVYGLYVLWQGNASSVMGGIWIGCTQCCADAEISQFHIFGLLIPLVCGVASAIPDDEWERRIQVILDVKAKRSHTSIFVALEEDADEEEESKSTTAPLTIAEFRATLLPTLFQDCHATKSFLSTLSTLAETN